MSEITFAFQKQGNAGKGILSASNGQGSIHTDKLDITSAADRTRYLDALCAGRPGIDRDAAAGKLEELAGGTVSDGAEGEEKERFSQAQMLIKLSEAAELFSDGDTGYATIPVDEHHENHPIHSKTFRDWLAMRFLESFKKVAGSQAMQEAINTLSGLSRFKGERLPVAVRLAALDGAVYLDLADDQWRTAKISPDGWQVVTDAPIRFIRRRGMLPLPLPQRGGSLIELRSIINAGEASTWRLIVAWLVMAFHPKGPYPILAVNGEQGSGKTTTSRIARMMIDPNTADLRAAPKNDRDLMIAACNGWVVGFDNLSIIPGSLSDALCRLATGGGFATRELYTNDDEKLFNATRPILFNGIEELASRPDLLERSIVVNLPTIDESQRRPEREIWSAFHEARPRILGALLDVVAAAIKNLPGVNLENRPRMADFAEWIVAAEPALPWPAGSFMADYGVNREAANEQAMEASAIGPALIGLMQDHSSWTGTAKELLAELDTDRRSDQKTRNRPDWPKTPKALSNALRRIAPALRRLGTQTTFTRQGDKGRARTIHLEKAAVGPSEPSIPSTGDKNRDFDAENDLYAGRYADGTDDPPDDTVHDRPPKNRDSGPKTGLPDVSDGADGQKPVHSNGRRRVRI